MRINECVICALAIAACGVFPVAGCADSVNNGNGGNQMVSATSGMNSLTSDVTTAEERGTFLQQLHTNTIEGNLAKPLSKETEKDWESAFWGMELCLYRNDTVLKSLRSALATQAQHSDSFDRAAMEAAYALYPTQLADEVRAIAHQTKNSKIFAMAAHYLLRIQPEKAKGMDQLLLSRFPDSVNDPILSQLRLNLEKPFDQRLQNRPSLVDLLACSFPNDAPVVFSFQRHNRDYPGLAVIRKPDGKFVRRQDGTVFAIGHLARSMSDCPGYLTNGNTPQGIFSIQNVGSSTNTFIGPSPTLRTVLPFERTVAQYLHDASRQEQKWNRELYANILPASWRDYVPIYEAYAAGEAGRGSMICHGTTVDPNFYKGKPYYPNSPSLGCMCALELWSPKDGHCVYSDQVALVNAYSALGSLGGYLVLVELDDQARPVELYDVIADLVKAEL